MINVLLISPRLPGNHPKYGGDNAYTDTLLNYPPPGVRYHHYEDLIAEGKMQRINLFQTMTYYLTQWRVLPPDMWFEALHSDFIPDLVHIVGFSAIVRFPRTVEHDIPVIIEAPSGSVSLLLSFLRWSERRARRAHWIKRVYLRAVGACDSSLNAKSAARVIVQSEYARRMHLDFGYVDESKLTVLRPGVPSIVWPDLRHENKEVVTFLFVGGDFDRKNGNMTLEAFQTVHKKYPEAQLVLVGRPADGRQIVMDGVTHYLQVPRTELFGKIYPQVDVFVFPTGAEGGFGVVLYEAMNFGLPIITVNAWAIPEIVVQDETGILIPYPPTAVSLADAMTHFLENRNLLIDMREAASRRFRRCFDLQARQVRLVDIYRSCLSNIRSEQRQ